MKIKLESLNEISILTVTETIQATDLAVLKAGLNKLFKSGKMSVLLDLTSLSEASFASADLLNSLPHLKTWAREQTPLFSFIGSFGNFVDFPDREKGLLAFQTDLPKLLDQEAKLTAQINAMTERRKKIDEELQALEPVESKLKKLKKENSELKRKRDFLNRLIRQSVTKRSMGFTPSEVVRAKLGTIYEVLFPVLEREGFKPRGHD